MLRPVPKNPRANAAYRRAILERAQGDTEFQREVWIRCSRDPIFFFDTFLWTNDPKSHSEAPHRPFITYPYQERTIHQIIAATGKHDLLAEKSRQMGFTWVICAVRLWFLLFRPGLSFLFGSRKEDLIDSPGDPITIFYKLDYMLNRLPQWMLPEFKRTEAHLENLDNNTTIDGESTNSNFARGGTKTAIDLDEFPAVENGFEILSAVGDATNSCLFFGTSAGAFGAFFDVRKKMMEETPEHIIKWHWSEHPEKRRGLYSTDTGESGGALRIIDTEHWSEHNPADYKFILDGKLRSVAYDDRERRAPNKQIMAAEWDIDYLAAASQWFDPKLIDRLKKETGCAPKHVGQLLFQNGDWRKPRWHEGKGGFLRLWFDWPDPDQPGVIPKDWSDIAGGGDISMGSAGEFSSNSVASFVRRASGEKIAEFVTNSLDPTEFCRQVLAICTWFNNCYLAWEANGPGMIFSKCVKDEGYRNVFMRDDSETKFAAKKTMTPGWWSTKDTKKILLADYANALLDGAYINHSLEALEECGHYIQLPNGFVEHARARGTEDAASTGESHGDRVISDALAHRAATDLAKRELEKKEEPKAPPRNSFAGRWESFRSRRKSEPYRWGSFTS
jgi:hypothetical protein